MAKQQLILGVQNNIIRDRLIVHRPKNMKDAIEYGRLLEKTNRTARRAANSNVKKVFALFLPRLRRDIQIRQIIAKVFLLVNERTTSFTVALAACEHKLRLRTVVAMWRLMDRRHAIQ